MQDKTKKTVVASAVISELQSSDMYLTIKARLFDLRANLNGVRVTEGFMDEIVDNEAKYICVPLCADVRGLLANRTIGHMYNARTGEFHSTQIGSFYHYEKEIDGDNAYLVGYARIMKRNKAVCKALSELFADNALKFSFEISCGEYTEMDDGTMLIDANPKNYFEGEAVVTFPACEDAVALALVAECLGKGDESMADEKNVTAELEAKEATAEIASEVEEVAEVQPSDTKVQTAETEVADHVYVTKRHVEHDETRAYNCDTGEEIEQNVTIETVARTPMELAEDQKDDKEDKPEEKVDEDDDEDSDDVVAEKSEEESEEEPDEEKSKEECAEKSEEVQAEASTSSPMETLIAELCASIAELKNEIAELKNASSSKVEESTTVVAEAEAETQEEVISEVVTNDKHGLRNELLNPFMAEITAPNKYTLLEKEESPSHKYSLLEEA